MSKLFRQQLSQHKRRSIIEILAAEASSRRITSAGVRLPPKPKGQKQAEKNEAQVVEILQK